MKRLQVNTIPGIEEVLIFNEDNSALSFTNPKVQASIVANTYVVSGPSQQKSPQEALSSMLNGTSIQQLMAQMGMQGGLPGMGAMGAEDDDEEDDDDDDVPELVGNFDQPE